MAAGGQCSRRTWQQEEVAAGGRASRRTGQQETRAAGRRGSRRTRQKEDGSEGERGSRRAGVVGGRGHGDGAAGKYRRQRRQASAGGQEYMSDEKEE